MCMEDIRIGRELNTNYKVINVVATVITRLASADPKRVSIAFGSTATQIYFQPGPSSIAAETGFGSLSNGEPFVARIQDYGQAVCQEWFGYSPVGDNLVTVIENTLERK